MNQEKGTTIVSAVMDVLGLGQRRRLGSSGARYLAMGGALGKGNVRHCSTWDLDYKLPRVSGRNRINDFNNR